MCDDHHASVEHLREIAEKIRQLARQTSIPQAKEELLDLADQIDRMADVAKRTQAKLGHGSLERGNGPPHMARSHQIGAPGE
jgi:uncharacterized protein Yka (UPF0111/DUF47 family)